jgi:transcriptional regulator
MLSRIVGIEIEITSLTGKTKLSQNKEARDRLHAAEALAARGHGELAQAMRKAG